MSDSSTLSPAEEIAQINRRIGVLFQRGIKIRWSLIGLAAQASSEGWTEEKYRAARRFPLKRLDTARLEITQLTHRLGELKSPPTGPVQ